MSWPSIPLKRIATLRAGGTPSVDEPSYWSDSDGGHAWSAISDMSSVDSVTTTARRISADGLRSARIKLGEPGTILFSMYASLGHTAWLKVPAAWNQAILGLLPDPTTDARFLRYSLVSLRPHLLEQARSNTQANLNAEQVGNLSIPRPPLDEQRRIADFLDAETAKIDALAAVRSTQAGTLGELELARIAERLCGTELRRARIETGWEWLPSIPDSWCVGPVYAYFDIQLGKMLNAVRASGEDQQPYLRNANVHWYEIDTEDLALMTFEPDERKRYGVRVGDLLVCEGGAGVAEAAVWDGRTSTCFYQKSLHRVRAANNVPVEWLMYWLRYAKAAGVFNADGNLATIPHLTGEQLAEYRIPIPPDGHRRVAELSSQIESIRKAQAEIESGNALLTERRQALVTAAVTGQLNVTTARGVVP